MKAAVIKMLFIVEKKLLFKVTNNLLVASSSGLISVFVPQDLSATLDTADHNI